MKTLIEKFIFILPLLIFVTITAMEATLQNTTKSISFSIIAAYAFYFFTVFIPTYRKQKIARKILAPYFTRLKTSTLTLISIFENLITVNEDGEITLHKQIPDLAAPIYFKQNNIIYKESLATILQKEVMQLTSLLDKITTNPSYQFLADNTINHLGSMQSMQLDDNINRLITDYNFKLKDKEFCKNIKTLEEACLDLFKEKTNEFIFPIDKKDKKQYDKTISTIRKSIKTHQLHNIKKVILNGVGTYVD